MKPHLCIAAACRTCKFGNFKQGKGLGYSTHWSKRATNTGECDKHGWSIHSLNMCGSWHEGPKQRVPTAREFAKDANKEE